MKFVLYNTFNDEDAFQYGLHTIFTHNDCFAYRDILNAIKRSDNVVFFKDFILDDKEVYVDIVFVNLYNAVGVDKNGNSNHSYFEDFLASGNQKKIAVNLKYVMIDPQQLVITKFGGMPVHLDAISMFTADDLSDFIRYMVRSNYPALPELDCVEKKLKMLNIPVIHFVQAMQIWKRFFNDWDLFEFFKNPSYDDAVLDLYTDRENDVVISGTQVKYIYPYRFHASVEIEKKMTHLKSTNTVHYFYSKKNEISRVVSEFLKNNSNADHEAKFKCHAEIDALQRDIFTNYTLTLRNSKIGIGCCSIFGFPLAKYFEMMANGVLVIGQIPFDSDYYGFVDNETMVKASIQELPEKIDFYLKNHDERYRIIKNAYDLMHKKYGLTVLVDQFFSKLESVAQKC